MNRYCFYIDGFNVYYALQNGYSNYRWLNYYKLAKTVICSKDEISHIYYFSSFVTWKPNSVVNHKEYIKALRSTGVEFIKGRFKDKTLKCHKCFATYKSHEEKQTDVNIAVQIVADAAANKFDKAVIISADTDLIPAITTVHNLTPEKEIGVMFPIGRNSFELRSAADFTRKMKAKHLDSCQFPQKLQVGKKVIMCPENWK
jgi:uncharacterized LabA/DUF88 family protein